MNKPSNYFKIPIIGTLTTKKTIFQQTDFHGNESEHVIESDIYEIIGEHEFFFVVNEWNDEFKKKPQLIPKEFVDSFFYVDERA